MTADDSPLGTYADELARLGEATADVKRLRAELAAAEAVATTHVGRALQACIAEDHNRTEVQLHSPFSPPTVRKIGESVGIPPDERYVRNVSGKTAVEPQPATRSMSRADELRAIARDLSDASAGRIADGLAVKHSRRLTVGKTPRETIENAIRANLATASDLR